MKTLSEQDKIEVLPFSEAQQEAIVGFCLLDSLFFIKCSERIKPGWFTYNPIVATLFDQLCKFYERHSRHIMTPDEFLGEPFFLEHTITDREKYKTVLANCLLSTRKFKIDTLKKYLTGFIRIALFKESIQGASGLFKVKGFEDAYIKTKERIQEIEKATFEDDGLVIKFANPEHWLADEAKQMENAISTGSTVLDAAMGGQITEVEQNGMKTKVVKGGLFKGEATAILAPTNSGKTTVMLTIARHAIYQKKNVLVLTHEGRPNSIRKTMLAGLLGMDKRALVDASSKGTAAMFKSATDLIDQHLTYIHYAKSLDMYIEDVIAEIKKRNEELRLRTGRGYDLIIDDYPAKLKSRALSKQQATTRVELAFIYDAFNMLAGELQTHCLVAVQTNRSGYVTNKDAEAGSSYLDIDSIAESYGVGQNMANMLSLNRSNADKRLNLLHMTVIKSRDSITHQTIHTRTDYGAGLTHGDSNMFVEFGNVNKPIGLISYLDEENIVRNAEDVHSYIQREESGAQVAIEAKGSAFSAQR